MSDTLQEEEDRQPLVREGDSVRIAGPDGFPCYCRCHVQVTVRQQSCAHCNSYKAYPPDKQKQEDQKAWLACCQGYTHAPWCSEYEPHETEASQLCPDGISSISAGSEHQPAARGRG